jgi:uncharacterized protein
MLHETKQLGGVEFKLAADGTTMEFAGYGAVFGNVDAYGDVIEPGAFAATIAEAKSSGLWPSMLLEHGGFGMTADDMVPIGIWTDLAEDGVGLKVSGKLADTQRGREAYQLLKMEPRPAITGLSIGYIAKESEPRSKPEDPRRRLKRIDLFEVSLVTFPANPRARVADVKSLDSMHSVRELEAWARDALGLGRDAARAFATRVKAVCQRDAEPPIGDLMAAARRAGPLSN